MTTVVVLDAWLVYRNGITDALAHRPVLQVLWSAAPEPAALARLQAAPAQVVVLGLSNVYRFVAQIGQVRAVAPGAGIVVIGPDDEHDDELLLRVAQHGGAAYLPRTIAGDTLAQIICRVAAGDEPMVDLLQSRPAWAAKVLATMRRAALLPTANSDLFAPLTVRELVVLDCIVRGRSNKEIGDDLSISLQTVKNHITALLSKLASTDRTEAAMYAVAQGWTSVAPVARAFRMRGQTARTVHRP